MFKFHFVLLLCAVMLNLLKAEIEIFPKNKTEISGRSGRYGFPETYENRLPSAAVYQEPSGFYPEFSDRRNYYDNEKNPPYEVPSGFDEFVPDKTSGPKYAYGPGGFYLPYPPKTNPDYAIEDIENRNKMTSPSVSNNESSTIKDLIIKAVRYIFGENDPDSVEIRPSLFTGIKQIFKDPLIALTAIVVPIGFLLANIIPFFAKLMMKMTLGPMVTSTIANTVARGLESETAEEILNAIQEFGAKSFEDPRCLQRFFCQAAKSHIESRSGDSWSIQNIIRKIAKAVDDNLWESLGLRMLFSSLQSGQCDNLTCGGDSKFFADSMFMKKLQVLFSKLFNFTETQLL